MKSHNLLIASAVLSVCGCGGSDKVAPSHGAPAETREKEPSAVARGTIAQNETVMDVKDAYAGWALGGDGNVLSIFFFPTLLLDDERERMASKEPGSDSFFVTANKASHDPAKFQWYPYIRLEITFKPNEPRSSENILDVFLAVNKLDDTGSHSIQLVTGFGGKMSPLIADGHEKLETMFTEDGKLQMTFKGKATIVDNVFAWNVSLKDQPVVK